MMSSYFKRIPWLILCGLMTASAKPINDPTTAPTIPSPIRMAADADTGSIKSIRADEAVVMDWVGFHGRWGEPTVEGHDLKPGSVEVKPEAIRARWSDDSLAVDIIRTPDADQRHWRETYRFSNLTGQTVSFDANALGIRVPLADDYKSGAAVCLTARCNAHLWAEGSSAWISALQMNGKPPHLGVVLTHGALDGYSIADRAWDSNDRGCFIVHPAIFQLAPKGSAEISWTIFTHQGWNDFFAQAKAINPDFIRLSADRYAVAVGEPIHLTADSANPLAGAKVTVNGRPVAAEINGGRLQCTFSAANPGDQNVELKINGRIEKLVALVTPKAEDLLRARAEFLMNKRQVLKPGDPIDGFFPTFDLDTGKTARGSTAYYGNAGERMAPGGFLGILWQRIPDGEFRERLKTSFLRYYAFLNREIQSPDGVVHSNVGYRGVRLYDFPWAAASHLCAWHITRDPECLQRLMRNLRAFYAKDGAHRYVIGQPIQDTLAALKEAGLEKESQEALGLFRSHADSIIATGINIPAHEVKYEQSIMGPAMQITVETALVTGNPTYLAAADSFRPMLEAFGGQQPDYRLHDIAIRHWDGYWAGKPRPGGQLYGDTMPQSWSAITAEAFRLYAAAAHHPEYTERARQILLANFSNYRADGGGHCAYLYPRSVNGHPAQYQDPYDHDQDWALVYYLNFENMKPFIKSPSQGN